VDPGKKKKNSQQRREELINFYHDLIFHPKYSLRIGWYVRFERDDYPYTSWWFQISTQLKNMLVKLGSSSPILGVKIKNI